MSIYQKRSVETDWGNMHLSTLSKIIDGSTSWPNVLSLDEDSMKIIHVPVIELVASEKPTMVVQCSSKHICCTPDHLILTSEGYKRADKIAIDDKVLLTNLSYAYVTGIISELKVRPVYDVYLDGGTNFTCFQLFVKSADRE